ncbi:mannosyl-oligosaccharide alpha-1,2-mannosidase [Exophiala aquamarina CBS 119918]|uniref:alpha-1,2-Mannosidase n=1 Tax=Exophiala aquamarina CBS 119918 TaxID=1182545 RepID=A0A072PIX6_9EURO|nr:mannosyl-oligosaccharide alpha-1,2-mannosidase [Exophiala aquamarina CBS 119918]KEF60089.1 mannosyl-oligosaccharide alpha-1,2-mannosidase [Exophiala aquamarina CBS 119918]
MILIRRLWLLPAFFISCALYYLFLYPKEPSSYPHPERKIHWVKHEERYPVAGYRDLPVGPLAQIPRIQYDFESHPEPPDAKSLREKRQAAIKDAFLHAWTGYKKHAWTRDEVAPISGAYRSSFGGWGATLVDTMDTLWIMDLKADFDQCVDVVKHIDFTTNEEEYLNIFETTIRYMGGLLAAYDLSLGKYKLLLDKAAELGEILYSAFDTPTHMPMARWSWKKTALGGEVEPSETTLLAELGSLTLEFTRLSQLTGDPKYFDVVTRIAEEMEWHQNKTNIPGLWPTIVNAKTLSFDYNHFTFGGMADSTYEYLPKQFMLLGGRDKRYKNMYEDAIEAAQRYLFFRPMLPKGEDVLFSGNAQLTTLNTIPTSNLEPQGQHLTCFVGGMVGIGAKIFARPDELRVARRLVEGCVWAYNAMPSGLMPETFFMSACQVGVHEPQPGKCDWNEDKWYETIAQRSPAGKDAEHMSAVERGKYVAKKKPVFPGFTDHPDNRYILRPEAIESIFILYRITGDRTLQETAWKMFQSIDTQTRTQIAHAAVHDVRKPIPEKSDRMESFWLAETLKYFYLIFSEPSLVNLDEWVLNTEAHPFRRPTS